MLNLDDDSAVRPGLASIRNQGFDGPVLILGGADLDIAPDDEILPLPVRLGELLSRLDRLWAAQSGAALIPLGPYDFAPAERALQPRSDGETVRLTELESRLLACLAEARGTLVGREQLLARVWGYSEDADTHTVETHVWRLRQKIETDDPASQFLLTEPGGYRLVLANGQSKG
jgi:DNA-binding response OmpR family regulator